MRPGRDGQRRCDSRGEKQRDRRRATLRVMIDTNVFDRLDADPEASCELENRLDIQLFVSGIQLAELEAIEEEAKRLRYVSLVQRLCYTVSAGLQTSLGEARHEPDRLIAAAALARCQLLVSDDRGLLEYAARLPLPVMDWRHFCSSILYGRR